MNRVLLLSELEAQGILYCAHRGGHEIYVAGNPEKNKALRHHPMCKKFIPLKNPLVFSSNADDLIEEIIEVIKREKIDVLLPSSFDCIRLVGHHREQLEKGCKVMPCPTLEAINMLDDKYNFYVFCKENNIRHPPSVLLKDVDSFNIENFTLKFPILLKPILGAGEKGIERFNDRRELQSFLARGSAAVKESLPALLQEYFDGEDIDFNGFAVNGEVKACSVMHTTFYKQEESFTLTDYTHNDAVLSLGKEILKKAAFTGPTNIDMRISNADGQVYLIEVNPRFWARGVSSLMDGMNFVDVGIRTAISESYSVQSKHSGKQWVSDLSPLLKAIFLHRDFSCFKYLFNLSLEQFRYIIFNKYYLFLTRKKRL